MPQVDLETLVCGGGGADGRVTCETLIDGEESHETPLESLLVRIGDDIGLVNTTAVYDRDDSTKGNTNPKSHQQQQQQNPNQNLRSVSQRFSGTLKKPKQPIIGLPNKVRHSGYLACSARRTTNDRIFPKGGAAAGRRRPAVEPGSPKVSCIGKVLSDRERGCRRRSSEKDPRPGCWTSIFALLRCDQRRCISEEKKTEKEQGRTLARAAPPCAAETAAAPLIAAPGLGGMNRFASGRRAASWGGDFEIGDSAGHVGVGWSEPLDREGTRGRRSLGSMEDLKRDLDW